MDALFRLVSAMAAWSLFSSTSVVASETVAHTKRVVNGVPVHVITVDLRDPHTRVGVEVASGFPRGAQPFDELASRTGVVAAINGGFFCTRTFRPIGDIVAGEHTYTGGLGTALAVDQWGRARLYGPRCKRHDWHAYGAVLGGGIALLRHGASQLDPEREGFRDQRVINGRAARAAAGLKPSRKLLLVATARQITLQQLRDIMLALGCRDAMALDGGHSVGLTCRGRRLLVPEREVASALVVRHGESQAHLATSAPIPRSATIAGRRLEATAWSSIQASNTLMNGRGGHDAERGVGESWLWMAVLGGLYGALRLPQARRARHGEREPFRGPADARTDLA